jgi:hypothetical protein
VSARVVYWVISIGTKVSNVFSRAGIDDEHAAVSVAIGDIQAVRGGIDDHVSGKISARDSHGRFCSAAGTREAARDRTRCREAVHLSPGQRGESPGNCEYER